MNAKEKKSRKEKILRVGREEVSHVTQGRTIQAEETAKDPAMRAKYTSMRTAWLELSD